MGDFFTLENLYSAVDAVIGTYTDKVIAFSTVIAGIFAVWSIYNTLFKGTFDWADVKSNMWNGILKPIMIVIAIASFPTIQKNIEQPLAKFNDDISSENNTKTIEQYIDLIENGEVKPKPTPTSPLEAIKEVVKDMYESVSNTYHMLNNYLNPINLIALIIEQILYLIYFGVRYIMLKLLVLIGPIALALTILDEDKQATFIKWMKLYGIVFFWGILMTMINMICNKVIDISSYQHSYDFSFSALFLGNLKLAFITFLMLGFKIVGYKMSRTTLEKALL